MTAYKKEEGDGRPGETETSLTPKQSIGKDHDLHCVNGRLHDLPPKAMQQTQLQTTATRQHIPQNGGRWVAKRQQVSGDVE